MGISEEQFGFVNLGKSTTYAIIALGQLRERYRQGQQDVHCVFIDLEKAYDRVPREELYWCQISIRQSLMYYQCETVVRCNAGTSVSFAVEVGLHQGSAFSPFLFAIVIDGFTDGKHQKKAPWQMMFADDVVLCAMEKDVLELELEQSRETLKREE